LTFSSIPRYLTASVTVDSIWFTDDGTPVDDSVITVERGEQEEEKVEEENRGEEKRVNGYQQNGTVEDHCDDPASTPTETETVIGTETDCMTE
jgi:hypothetical protein